VVELVPVKQKEGKYSMIKEKIPFLRRMTAFCAFSCGGGGISIISLLGTPVRLSYGGGHDEKNSCRVRGRLRVPSLVRV
jgi:hypothetical protein